MDEYSGAAQVNSLPKVSAVETADLRDVCARLSLHWEWHNVWENFRTEYARIIKWWRANERF